MSDFTGLGDLAALVTSARRARRTLRRGVSLARMAVLRSVRSFVNNGGGVASVEERRRSGGWRRRGKRRWDGRVRGRVRDILVRGIWWLRRVGVGVLYGAQGTCIGVGASQTRLGSEVWKGFVAAKLDPLPYLDRIGLCGHHSPIRTCQQQHKLHSCFLYFGLTIVFRP